MRARLVEFLANWAHAEPFDAGVVVLGCVAFLIVLGAGAVSWWRRYAASCDGDWLGEGNVRR